MCFSRKDEINHRKRSKSKLKYNYKGVLKFKTGQTFKFHSQESLSESSERNIIKSSQETILLNEFHGDDLDYQHTHKRYMRRCSNGSKSEKLPKSNTTSIPYSKSYEVNLSCNKTVKPNSSIISIHLLHLSN